jgi:hypothetical protein
MQVEGYALSSSDLEFKVGTGLESDVSSEVMEVSATFHHRFLELLVQQSILTVLFLCRQIRLTSGCVPRLHLLE